MSAPARAPLPPALRLGMLAWAALVALQPLWYLWLAPPARLPPGLALALAGLPLLLPLAAWRRPRRALLWAGIFSLFYFCHGIAESWSSPAERAPALAETALSLLLIVALGASVKRGGRGD
jgi:uncharacterized membrane protein